MTVAVLVAEAAAAAAAAGSMVTVAMAAVSPAAVAVEVAGGWRGYDSDGGSGAGRQWNEDGGRGEGGARSAGMQVEQSAEACVARRHELSLRARARRVCE